MQTDTLDIRALAEEFIAAHPDLDPPQQRLALAAVRLLGEGRPFAVHELAERAHRPLEEVASFFEHVPLARRDGQGRVVGFAGLSLDPTSHALELEGGRTLYADCALDTLFLPELLGQPARIRSADPETGEPISLAVDAAGAHDIAPDGAVMTLHGVSGFELEDAVGTFCCYVNFFASEKAAHAWAGRNQASYVVSIPEGFEYGRLYNHRQLGAALEEGGA